jgi:hypothetical protein
MKKPKFDTMDKKFVSIWRINLRKRPGVKLLCSIEPHPTDPRAEIITIERGKGCQTQTNQEDGRKHDTGS